MADRNVNVRLQVLDGGKVKAELQSVGEAGGKALDALQQKSQQAGATVNKLATHEVTNLAAQLSDLGIQIAGGGSPLLALVQQGGQISQILGDRGVKGIIGAVGQGILSLVTPTTLLLGGIAAAGYAASFAIDALSGGTEDLNDVLDESKQATDDFTFSMEKAGKGAENFAQQIREVATLQATENLRKLTEAYENWSRQFASGFTMPSVDPLGNVTGGDEINARFAPFEEAIRRFQDTVAAGRPDIQGFARDVATIGNANPELSKTAAELIKAAENGGTLSRQMEIAAARVAFFAGTATDAQRALLNLSDTMQGINGGINVLAELERKLQAAGSEREKFIEMWTSRAQGSPDWILADITKRANALFDQNKKLADGAKATRSLASEQKRFAKEVIEDTRTAAEAYGIEIEKLSTLLKEGRIDQETFNRAVANAAKEMEKAERAALDKQTDAGSGFKRAFGDYLKSAADMATATENLTNNVLDGLGDAMAQFVTTGKLNFKDLTNSILADLARLATQRLLSMLLSSFLPGGGGISYGNAGGTAGILPAIHHGGGMVGAGGAFGRMFPAEAFLGAPRLHDGGGWFRPNERPAVLEVGERVQSRAEVAAGNRRPTVVNRITNYSGADIEARDGGTDADGNQINEMIISTVQKGYAQGRFNSTMRGTFGLGNNRPRRGSA